MSMTDPIADMLTRIRNAGQARLKKTDIPASKMKLAITKILLRERFIANFKYITDGKQNVIRVYLRYGDKDTPMIKGLQRVSTPGLRTYVASNKIPWVRRGTGVAVISTSKGLLTDREARLQKLGGEVVFTVW
ncbi:30S ribosomal protein S8 [bacterium]|nr:30S ribosomal protein S8 [bacterium]